MSATNERGPLGAAGIVDVHCHVHAVDFDQDRDQVLRRAAAAGVTHVLAMGEGLADNQRLIELCRRQRRQRATGPSTGPAPRPLARVVPCFGLHPDRAGAEAVEPVIEQIRQAAGELAAIGEVGLDFRVAEDEPARARQRQTLTALARLALELDLPLSVHSRSAGHHAIALLAEVGSRRVCMHAFDGAAKHAVRAVEEHGFVFSVPPSVVRSPQKQKLVRRLPLEALLIETDSPVLGPDREARNEPANARTVVRYLAEAMSCDERHVSRVTSDTARRLFGR